MKRQQIDQFRERKRNGEMYILDMAAFDIIAFLGSFVPADLVIASVACGHSRVSDCFAKRLANCIASVTEQPFLQVWADRPITGSSHPRKNAQLKPLEMLNKPDRLTLVVDDVATSGHHMHEALTSLRTHGVPAIGVAWIGGTVQRE